MSKKKNILDLDLSSSSSEDGEDYSSSDNDVDDNKLTINSTYAKEYETRKRKQELTNERRQTFNGDLDSNEMIDDDDDDSSSEESEDEDGELLTAKVDLQILKVRLFFCFFGNYIFSVRFL